MFNLIKKIFCKFISGGGNFKARTSIVKGLATLVLVSSVLTACTDEAYDVVQFLGQSLKINVGVNQHQGRAVVTGNNLVDASEIGVTVVDATETAYQKQDYNNVRYTASTDDGKQVWTPDKDVTLSGEPATLYAYYPWVEGTDIGGIQVDMTEQEQKDWMYATPVENLNDANATANVTLHHALANFKLTVYKEEYSGAGQLSDFTLTSDAFATGGTFNAKTGLFTAYTGEGAALTRSVDYTLTDKTSSTHHDAMVVPTGDEAAITASVTVDGHTYTSTTAPITLTKGKAYELVLKLTSTGLEVNEVTLTDWNEVNLGETNFEPIETITKTAKVYAVRKGDEALRLPEEIDTENEKYIAVALITDNQKIVIAPQDAANGSDIYFNWGYNLYQKDVAGIAETTDEAVAKADFAGAANTVAIIAAYTEHSVEMSDLDMCKVLQDFNAGSDNLGHTDWYVPALGQLYEMYTYKSDINTVLTKIGGKTIASDFYWSSSENSSDYAWLVRFDDGYVVGYFKTGNPLVRLVRDID